MHPLRTVSIAVLSVAFGGACGRSAPLTFTDVTEEAGIHFVYTFGDSTYENILESSGSGVTVFD